MSTSLFRAGSPALWAGLVVVLAGCGGVSELTQDRVARSQTAVQQAEQNVGESESGQLELERAKENLDQARQALDDNDEEKAERAAQMAELDAELAVAKSQSARARKAADELLASIQTLREEAARGTTTPPERSPPEQ